MNRIAAWGLFALSILLTPVLSAHAQTVDERVEELLSRMSLEEKIGQTALRGMSSRHKGPVPENLTRQVKDGKVGAFLNVMIKPNAERLQRAAVEESRLGIPLLFARDVIHGFRTVFPIPLGQAASWNPESAERGARIAAVEASTYGVRWTFAPMMDIARDPRWGRIAESFGEDPYLSELFATAMIEGFQGDDLSDPTSLAATAKHYAGYGAAEGGRDYNTTWIPENLLRNVYLRPFHAAVEAGAATMMSGFNDLNGVPVATNLFLLTEVLRDEWGFDGFVVSDWESLTETIDHGFARDPRHAAELGVNAGLDMEMVSTAYEDHLADLIREGKVSEAQLDQFVRRILHLKFKLGLFDQPYFDPDREKALLNPDALAAARQAASESFVLLKNDDVLPLSSDQTLAVIGPLADAPHEQLGTWAFDGKKENTRTPLSALKAVTGENIIYEPALGFSRDRSRERFDAAVKAAKKSDVVVFFAGEEAILSGEAHSRADITLPGAQQALIKTLAGTGKPIVLVILAGRPIVLHDILDDVDAVLIAWHPGTMGGPALADVLLGETSPSGRLPVTWPKSVGQIPVYYNHKRTGRPPNDKDFVAIDDIPIGAWQSSLGNDSHYLDIGFRPEFPFGFGLTYTTFAYKDLRLDRTTVPMGDTLEVSAIVSNTGRRTATEVVQLYTHDLVGDVTRPVRELKGFQRVTLEPGQSRRVLFRLHTDQLAFYNQSMQNVTEPGEFKLWIAPNAVEGLEASFEVVASGQR